MRLGGGRWGVLERVEGWFACSRSNYFVVTVSVNKSVHFTVSVNKSVHFYSVCK